MGKNRSSQSSPAIAVEESAGSGEAPAIDQALTQVLGESAAMDGAPAPGDQVSGATVAGESLPPVAYADALAGDGPEAGDLSDAASDQPPAPPTPPAVATIAMVEAQSILHICRRGERVVVPPGLYPAEAFTDAEIAHFRAHGVMVDAAPITEGALAALRAAAE